MVVLDLPYAVLVGIDKGVPRRDRCGDARWVHHGEIIEPRVHRHAAAVEDRAFDDGSARMLLQEMAEVFLDGGRIGARHIRDGGKQHRIRPVKRCDALGVERCQREVPGTKEFVHRIIRRPRALLGGACLCGEDLSDRRDEQRCEHGNARDVGAKSVGAGSHG